MSISSVDVSELTWFPQVRLGSSKKLDIFKLKSALLIEQNINCLCSEGHCRTKTCSGKSCIVEFLSRIGSRSAEGEVYHVKLHDANFAFKLLPVTSSQDIAKNKNELRIANLVSELVLAGRSLHFPVTYASGVCDNVKYFKGSGFMRQTINWAIKRALEKAMVLAPKSHVRRLQRKLEYNPTPFKVVEAYAKENKELNYPLFEKFFERETLFGNYLCSELAWGDLSQYLEGGHADTTRKQSVLLKGMIESVNDLQENINVVHNDLHLGNFLIQSEKHPVVLMHDFGKSQVVEGKWTTEERITDLDMMVSALQAAPQLYHLTTPFQKLLQDLSEQIVSYEKAKSTYNLAPTFLNQVGSLQSYHMR